jgi:hypothetical protein
MDQVFAQDLFEKEGIALQAPKPFVWTATVEKILEKIAKSRRLLEQIEPGCTAPKVRKIGTAICGTLH